MTAFQGNAVERLREGREGGGGGGRRERGGEREREGGGGENDRDSRQERDIRHPRPPFGVLRLWCVLLQTMQVHTVRDVMFYYISIT